MPYLNRRTLLSGAAALGASACANVPPPAPSADGALDATSLAALIRSRHISQLEVVDAAISRVEAAQPSLNFLVAEGFERARAKARAGAARGPFAGVPFLVKDLNDVIGLPTRDGARGTAGARPATAQDSYFTAFDDAGLITIGKSSTPEMGYSVTTEPLAFGPTRNPWDITRSSGGSSGGAAVAVAAGIVPVAHANDGGGSIRVPAACCGVFGLKPSRGRQRRDRAGASPIDFAIQHVISRSVRDSAALLAITEAQTLPAGLETLGFVGAPLSRPLKVGVVRIGDAGQAPDASVDAALTATQALLTAMGHELIEAHWPLPQSFMTDFMTFWSSGALRTYDRAERLLGRAPDDANVIEPFTIGLAAHARSVGPEGLTAAVTRLRAMGEAFNRWLEGFDVVLSPVVSAETPEIGYLAPDVPFETLSARMTSFMGHTPIHNVSGAPAMSVPLNWNEAGLPIGMQFSAPLGGERVLLELAYALEAAQPWAQRLPPAWFG